MCAQSPFSSAKGTAGPSWRVLESLGRSYRWEVESRLERLPVCLLPNPPLSRLSGKWFPIREKCSTETVGQADCSFWEDASAAVRGPTAASWSPARPLAFPCRAGSLTVSHKQTLTRRCEPSPSDTEEPGSSPTDPS